MLIPSRLTMIAIVALFCAGIHAQDRLAAYMRIEGGTVFLEPDDGDFEDSGGMEDRVEFEDEETPLVGLTVGSYVVGTVRTELSWLYITEQELAGPYVDDGSKTGFTAKSDYSSHVGLVSVFVDSSPDEPINLFAGAGIGAAFHNVGETNINDLSAVEIEEGENTSLAWQLGVGVEFKLSERAWFDISYRYLDLGTAESGDTARVGGISGTLQEPLEYDLVGHAVLIGFRIKF